MEDIGQHFPIVSVHAIMDVVDEVIKRKAQPLLDFLIEVTLLAAVARLTVEKYQDTV
jgi:hypothetical protein